jgi:hypothetical protein
MVKKIKVKKVVPYNERERNAKILNLIMQINEMQMGFVLTTEIKKNMDEFVKNGTTYIDVVDLPRFGRQMVINLINDKHQQTFINFKYIDSDENKKCDERYCNEGKCCEK